MIRLFLALFVLALPVQMAMACGEIVTPAVGVSWGNGGWGWNRPQQVWAYQGQSCSAYPGYGPQCAPGLVCANPGFNVGFGVCQVPGGWNNGGWNNGGWYGYGPGGWHR